jgi:hypothetical protein
MCNQRTLQFAASELLKSIVDRPARWIIARDTERYLQKTTNETKE